MATTGCKHTAAVSGLLCAAVAVVALTAPANALVTGGTSGTSPGVQTLHGGGSVGSHLTTNTNTNTNTNTGGSHNTSSGSSGSTSGSSSSSSGHGPSTQAGAQGTQGSVGTTSAQQGQAGGGGGSGSSGGSTGSGGGSLANNGSPSSGGSGSSGGSTGSAGGSLANNGSPSSGNSGSSGGNSGSSGGQNSPVVLASTDSGTDPIVRGGGSAPGASSSTAPAGGSQELIVTATIPQTSDVSTGNFVFNSGGGSSAQVVTAAPIVPQTVAATGLAGIVAPSASSNTQVTAAVAGTVVAPDGSQRVAIDLYGDKLLSFAIDPTTGKKIAASNGTLANSGTAAGDSVTMLASMAQEVVHSTVNLTGVRQANGFFMRDGRIVLVFVDKGGGR